MPASRDQEPRPVDIIFNCVICNAILPDVYKNAAMDKGFRDAENRDHQEPVTKMWLSECTHFFCGKHLEGGGVPFHKKGETPRASCPACVATKGDKSKKALYAIRGLDKGQYDERIPRNWFDTPPVALTTEGKGMDAMRFHYLSLVRFGCQLVVRLREAEKTADEALKAAAEEGERARTLAQQTNGLHERIQGLEKCEKELKPWKERGPSIKRCLNIFTEVQRENEKLREQLTAMGYAVPNRSYRIDGDHAEAEQAHVENDGVRPSLSQRDTRTAGRSQNAESLLPFEAEAGNDSQSNRTLSGHAQGPIANLHANGLSQYSVIHGKRPRAADMEVNDQRPSKSPKFIRAPSTELMPPPPVPFRRPPESKLNTNVNGTSGHGASPLPVATQTPRQPVRGESNATAQRGPQGHVKQSYSSPLRPPSRDQWSQGHNQSQRNLQDEPGDSFPPFQTFNGSGARELTSRHFQPTQTTLSPHPSRFPDPPQSAGDTIAGLRGGDHSMDRTSNFLDLGQYAHPQTPRGLQQHIFPGVRHAGAGAWSSPRRQTYQLPTTPSPRKQMGPRQTSVASPFFSRNGATQHTGRVTLPDRSERPQASLRNHNYSSLPNGHQSQQPGTQYASHNQPDQYQYGPAPMQRSNLFTRQMNHLPPATPSMRLSFQSGYPQANNMPIPESRHVNHFNPPNSARMSSAAWGPPLNTVLSKSGHRSGASKASNEWRKEQRMVGGASSQQPEMHLGHFLDAGRGGTGASTVQNQLGGRRSVRR